MTKSTNTGKPKKGNKDISVLGVAKPYPNILTASTMVVTSIKMKFTLSCKLTQKEAVCGELAASVAGLTGQWCLW